MFGRFAVGFEGGWLVFCRRFGALRWLSWDGFPGGGGIGCRVCIKSSEVL